MRRKTHNNSEIGYELNEKTKKGPVMEIMTGWRRLMLLADRGRIQNSQNEIQFHEARVGYLPKAKLICEL